MFLTWRFFRLLFGFITVAAVFWAALSARQLVGRHQQVLILDVTSEINRLTFLPSVLAQDPRLINLLEGQGDVDALNDALALWARRSGAEFVFLMDGSGTVRATSNAKGPVSFLGQNYGFRPYFHGALNNGSASFFAVGATTGEPGYFLASAVANAEGRHEGVLVVKARLQLEMTPKTTTWLVADDLDYVILSGRPEWLYRPWRVREGQGESALSQRRYEPKEMGFALGPQMGGVQFVRQGISWHLAQVGKIEDEAWTLATLLPVQTFMLMVLGRLLLLLLIAAVFMLALALYRQQRRQAQDLAREVALATAQLRTAQGELVKAENWAVLGALSTAIVHEINQPLNSLRFDLASLERLGRLAPARRDEGLVKDVLQQTRMRGDRMARIVETLRLFARGHSLKREAVDLRSIAQEAVHRLREERPNTAQDIHMELPEAAVVQSQSAVLLVQVLVNLLTNALAATKGQDAPKIDLRLWQDAGAYGFEVRDSGPGLPQDLDLDSLEPGQSGKPLGEGFGLGLFLSKIFVERLGGVLSYSYLEGTSCFRLEFGDEHA